MNSYSDPLDTLRKCMLVDGYNLLLDLNKSSGAWLHDSKKDEKYLDMATFFASLPLGLNHESLNSSEAKRELDLVARNKISNSDFYTSQMVDFVDMFRTVAMPDYFKYVFFVEGGTLGVENGLKTAFDWKVRLNHQKGMSGEVGHQVLHFKDAFHGRSGYTLSLTNSDPTKYMYFPKFKWPRILNPKVKFPLEDNLEHVEKTEKMAYNEIEQAFAQNKDDIAAIIIEPIQGEGGDNHFRDEFFVKLRKYADENDAMLIYDEVQTGIGLTGNMWYADSLPAARPDIIAFGKKTQVCGMMVNDTIERVDEHVFKKSSRLNSTWGGNLVDMVRAKYYLKAIDEESLIVNAKRKGKELKKRLCEISESFDDAISNVRGKGLMVAFDLHSSKERDKLKADILKEKLLMLGCGDISLRFRPRLNVTEEELESATNILEMVIKRSFSNS